MRLKIKRIFILVKVPNFSNKNIKKISQKYNFPKKILTISNQIKNFKYSLTNNDSDNYIQIRDDWIEKNCYNTLLKNCPLCRTENGFSFITYQNR